MNIKTKGIVLHKTKYSETSVIVSIFTRTSGVKSFIVKGAFSKKNRATTALLENLSLVEIVFDDNHHSIQYLKEIALYQPFSLIPFDMVRRSLMIFYNELIYKLLRDFQTDGILYDFIEKSILELDAEATALTDVHLRFMVRLSRIMGFYPQDNYSVNNCHFSIEDACFVREYFDLPTFLSRDASCYLHQMMNEQVETVPPKTVRNELLQGLLNYFEIHNDQIRKIDSVAILSQILN